MDNDKLNTRVLRTYIQSLMAPTIVSLKRIIQSNGGWMTSMLNQTNAAMQSAKENNDEANQAAARAQKSAADSLNSAQNSNNSANASQSAATESQARANDSLSYANRSLENANQSQSYAGKAQDSANQASASANRANDSANRANDRANDAQNSANNANNAANDSRSSADRSTDMLHAMQQIAANLGAIWLGDRDGDPDKDTNGNPLRNGAMYHNTRTNHVRIWENGQWSDVDAPTEQAMQSALVSAQQAAASANSAQGSANSANDAANRANDRANDAGGYGHSAWIEANRATDRANDAQNSANNANNAANRANDSANWAGDRANNANDAANRSNDQANRAQDILNNVNGIRWDMNAFYLGVRGDNPNQDRNGNGLTQGCWYFNSNNHRLMYWNGWNWQTITTQDDLNNVQNNMNDTYLRRDGGNNMYGPLDVDLERLNNPTGDWIHGIVLRGTNVWQNRWAASPGIVAQIGTSIIRSFFTTVNDSQDSKSYARIRHCDGGGGWRDFLFTSRGEFMSSGDVWAGMDQNSYFRGKAVLSANADVAEIYATKIEFPKGTLVSISKDPDPKQEIDLCINRDDYFGVISTDPGMILNSKAKQGQAVGLEGRVPMRVLGPVKKGDRIYLSDKAGVATADIQKAASPRLLGFALQSDTNQFECLVEVALKA